MIKLTFSGKTCHPPLLSDNSSMTPVLGVYQFEDVIHFSCDMGFEKESGYWEQRCSENGTWSNEEPIKCKRKLTVCMKCVL